jgi:glucosamine 6-phosphate synthetase-like amidotransferase/phosphosugar isomerase protein
MCGIATAVSPATNIVPALLGGLRKREYTGYDSADVAVLNDADAATLLMGVCSLLLLACNARYHSGVTASYWLESLAGIPCTVEIASETATAARRPIPTSLSSPSRNRAKPPTPGSRCATPSVLATPSRWSTPEVRSVR